MSAAFDHQASSQTDYDPAEETAPGGAERNAALRGLGYDEGAAQLAPVQLLASAKGAKPGKRVFKSRVIQLTANEWDKPSRRFKNTALIWGGKNKQIKTGMLVRSGMYKGTVINVFAAKCRVRFYDALPPSQKQATIHLDKTWSRAKAEKEWARIERDSEDAGETGHTKRERGNQ